MLVIGVTVITQFTRRLHQLMKYECEKRVVLFMKSSGMLRKVSVECR